MSNIIYLLIASKPPGITEGPFVSVLIPARNEEDNIGQCLESLSGQTYRNYEIIVLDDQSDDATLEIITAYKEKISNLKVIRGKPLPEDWNGKPYAMHQLAAAMPSQSGKSCRILLMVKVVIKSCFMARSSTGSDTYINVYMHYIKFVFSIQS